MATVSIEMQVQERVREIVYLLMQRPITEDIAMQVETFDNFKSLEIVDGEWIGFELDEYMTGEEHGRIEYKLLLRLGNHVEPNDLGMLYPGDMDFVLDGEPGNIHLKLRPDIGFVKKADYKPSKKYHYGAPTLAIEITSPNDRPGKVQEKINHYLKHGVQQVWQIYPQTQQIIVYLPDGTSKTYNATDTLHGGDVLPNFALNIAQIFKV